MLSARTQVQPVLTEAAKLAIGGEVYYGNRVYDEI